MLWFFIEVCSEEEEPPGHTQTSVYFGYICLNVLHSAVFAWLGVSCPSWRWKLTTISLVFGLVRSVRRLCCISTSPPISSCLAPDLLFSLFHITLFTLFVHFFSALVCFVSCFFSHHVVSFYILPVPLSLSPFPVSSSPLLKHWRAT